MTLSFLTLLSPLITRPLNTFTLPAGFSTAPTVRARAKCVPMAAFGVDALSLVHPGVFNPQPQLHPQCGTQGRHLYFHFKAAVLPGGRQPHIYAANAAGEVRSANRPILRPENSGLDPFDHLARCLDPVEPVGLDGFLITHMQTTEAICEPDHIVFRFVQVCESPEEQGLTAARHREIVAELDKRNNGRSFD